MCACPTGDAENDRPILADQSQFIVWAYGPRADEEGLRNLALFHTEYPRNGGECMHSSWTNRTHYLACMAICVFLILAINNIFVGIWKFKYPKMHSTFTSDD